MKISLISPPLSLTDRYGKELGKVGSQTEPLGLAYIAASIKQNRNDTVEIIDAAASRYTYEDLKEYILKTNPDIIGMTILTPMYKRAIDTINMIKEISPETKIVIGGPHPTKFPEELLRDNKNIDFCVIGEGEKTIINLLNAIENNGDLKKINGIAYRQNKKIIVTGKSEVIKNLDDVPFPARELLYMEKYHPAPTYYRKLPSYIILTSRGCPFNCTYCSKIFGKIYRHHSVDRIIDEINILTNQYNAKEIVFRDDTFTIDRKFVIDLCNRLINEEINKKIKWTCMTRVNIVDKELLKLMKKSGCWSIHYGVESGSQRLLDLIKKGITLEEVRNAFKWTREAGIETKAFFMLGLPTETKEESLQTIKFAKEINPNMIQVTLTVPYPDTELYEIAKKDGTLKSLKWEDYQTWAAWSDKELVYVAKGRNSEELKRLQKKAMFEFYFRPSVILRTIFSKNFIHNIRIYILGGYALFKKRFTR